MAGERSRVREGVDDLGLGAGRIEIGREERRLRLGPSDHVDPFRERGDPLVAFPPGDPESADEDDGFGHGGPPPFCDDDRVIPAHTDR